MNNSYILDAARHYALEYNFSLWVFIPHCILAIARLKPFIDRRPFLLQIVLCVAGCAGGGTLARFFLGLRPPWIDSPEVIPWITVCWYLIIIHKIDFLKYRVIRLPLNLLDEIARSRAIFTHFHLAVLTIPNAPWTGVILVATIAGCGGSYLAGIAKKIHKHDNVFELLSPGWGTFSSLLAAIALYISHASHTEDLVKMVIVAVFVIQAFGSDMIGNVWVPPPFKQIGELFFLVTRIDFFPQNEINELKKDT